MANKLLFGCDPEVFVCETINQREFAVPVPHFIYHEGVAPLSIDPLGKHPVMLKKDNFSVMMDGVAFEMTLPPTDDAKIMHKNISDALDAIGEFAAHFGDKVVIKPAVNYDFSKYYDDTIEMFYQCGIFGCDPDEDAILTDGYTSPEIDVKTHPFRYGGGHFHTSDNNALIKEAPLAFVKLMAITCGNYSIAHSPYPDLEHQRAWKYGQPARYRIQHYPDNNIGVEYRSPSNCWIANLESIEGMFHWARKAYQFFEEKRVDVIQDYLESTVKAISNADQLLACAVLNSLV